jgi:hypothetical protein
MTKPNIPKKLSLLELIKYAEGEIAEWQEFIKKAEKKLGKLEKKN